MDVVYQKKDEALWRDLGLYNNCLLREEDFSGITLLSQLMANEEEEMQRKIA